MMPLSRARPHFVLLALAVGLLAVPAGASIRERWSERLKTVVAVEFFTETELDRRPTVTFGVVIDTEGTILVPGGAMNPRFAPDQLKDFRVYLPGQSTRSYTAATYVGQDVLMGWHVLRVAESLRPSLVPITTFAGPRTPDVGLGDTFWGIGLRGKDEDFQPYLLSSAVAVVQTLPQKTAVCMDDIAAPGLPVFTAEGVFAGLGVSGFGQTFMQFSQRDRGGTPIVLVNLGETSAFLLAHEVLPYLARRPADAFGRPLPWFGAHGLQPIDPEVLAFLKLESGCVVSEVLAGSPAEKAGLKDRDMIIAIDGAPLPRLKPDRVVPSYLQREISRRRPGDVLRFTVQRGQEKLELSAELKEEPKTPREGARAYYDRLGFTAREFVFADGIGRRAPVAQHQGLIAHFVKANSPAATAGLGQDDWIREVDGVAVTTFEAAAAQLKAIQDDNARAEAVLLIQRGGETQVLRIKLK
jgi:serine protease Do